MCKKVRVSLSEEDLELLISSLDCYRANLLPFISSLVDDAYKKKLSNFGLQSCCLRSRFWELKKKHFGLYPFYETDFSNFGFSK